MSSPPRRSITINRFERSSSFPQCSPVEPDSIADQNLVERLAAEISDEDYEEKIAGLLSRCYAAEIAGDRGAKKAWTEAFATLNRGDYILIIDHREPQRASPGEPTFRAASA